MQEGTMVACKLREIECVTSWVEKSWSRGLKKRSGSGSCSSICCEERERERVAEKVRRNLFSLSACHGVVPALKFNWLGGLDLGISK